MVYILSDEAKGDDFVDLGSSNFNFLILLKFVS